MTLFAKFSWLLMKDINNSLIKKEDTKMGNRFIKDDCISITDIIDEYNEECDLFLNSVDTSEGRDHLINIEYLEQIIPDEYFGD